MYRSERKRFTDPQFAVAIEDCGSGVGCHSDGSLSVDLDDAQSFFTFDNNGVPLAVADIYLQSLGPTNNCQVEDERSWWSTHRWSGR